MGYLIQRQIRQHLHTHWPKIATGDHTELAVLYTLADHANEGDAAKGATVDRPGGTRKCHPTIKTITRQGVASERQVQRALAELRRKGYITTVKHASYATNEYTVTDMVAGQRIVDSAMSTAVMALASRSGVMPEEAEKRLSTAVAAWEAVYAEQHDGCAPLPDLLARAINDVAAALIATSTGAEPVPGAVPEVRLRVA